MYMKTKTILKMMGIILLTGMVIFAATSCIRIVGIRGSGNVKSEDRSVSGFDSISIGSGMNLFLKQGSSESLKIEAEDNILPLIITAVENGKLKIKYKNLLIGGLNLIKPVNIYLTVKDLKEIDVSSGVKIESEEIKSDSLKIDLSSGAEGNMIIISKKLIVGLSSGSTLEISGQADSQDIDVSSGAAYRARDLISKSIVVDVSSGSNAVVNASESLDVKISSGATVEYAGSPKVTSDISSGGVLKSISND
jgi:hypothetical protein